MVQSLVYDRALRLIFVGCAKMHKTRESSLDLGPCNCTIKQSMGIPRFYTVHKRLSNSGYILLTDIHPFWWYKRPEQSTSSTTSVHPRRLVLNPAVVRGKGPPRGSKNKKGYEITNTRRDSLNLSTFHHRRHQQFFVAVVQPINPLNQWQYEIS
jgi:hypothetical protein